MEDNAAMRRLIATLLSDLAETIIECDDGAQAVEAHATAALTGTDWVLMDVRLQQLDGLQATRDLKARWPDVRVVIVTAYNDAKLRAATMEAGARGYMLIEDLLALRQMMVTPSPD